MSGESDESGNEIFLTQTNFSQINTDYDSDTILDGLLDLLEEKSHHGKSNDVVAVDNYARLFTLGQ